MLRLGDSVRVVLLGLPADDRYAPAWRLVAQDAQAAVFLVDGDEAAFFPIIPLLLERRRPVALVGEAPTCAERLGSGVVTVPDLPSGLARVLERLSRRPSAGGDRSASSA